MVHSYITNRQFAIHAVEWFLHLRYIISRSGSGKQKSQHVSVVEMPSQNSIQQNQCPLTMTTLLHLAPSVAARMEWQREMVC